MSIAIFCKSFRDDFHLLQNLFDSREMYCSSLRILLSVPRGDVAILKRDVVIPAGCDVIADEEYAPPETFLLHGWLQQQVCKLRLHHLGYAEHFFVVDSDSYFISELTDGDIVEDGKLRIYFSRVSTVMRPGNEALSDYLAIGDRTLGNHKYRAASGGDIVGAAERLGEFRKWFAATSQASYEQRLGKIEEVFLSPAGVHCQPAQILHSSLLREMEEYFLGCGITIPELIKLSPWEYNWYAHWAAAAKPDEIMPSVPWCLHFPDEQSVKLAQSQGYTEAYFSKIFRTIAMAARHFESYRYIDPPEAGSAGYNLVNRKEEAVVTPLDKLRQKYGPTGPANLLERFNAMYPFAGKRVFELGSHVVLRELALGQFRAAKWFACDVIRRTAAQPDLPDPAELLGELIVPVEHAPAIAELAHLDFAVIDGDICRLEGFSNAFDLSISVNAFGHLADLPRALSVIERILVPGGVHIAAWAPIWSGQMGHHLDAVHDAEYDRTYHMTGLLPFDPWDHLLLSPAQMYEKLIARCSRAAAGEIVRQVYTSERINRYFADDYLKFFELSGMELVVLEKDWIAHPAAAIAQALYQRYPDKADFSTNALFVVLRKNIA